MMKKLLILLYLAQSTHIWACEVPPEEQHSPVTELVERTSTIVLARAIGSSSNVNYSDTEYTFSVIRALKGTAPDTVRISDGLVVGDKMDQSFNDHSDDEFWGRNGWVAHGRLFNAPDCRIHPYFTIGTAYLLFLDKPYHSKSFEQINNLQSDQWLLLVLKLIENEEPGAGQDSQL